MTTSALVADATVASLGLMCLLSWLRSVPLFVRLCYGGLTMAALFDVAAIVAASTRNDVGRGVTAAHRVLLAAAVVTVVVHLLFRARQRVKRDLPESASRERCSTSGPGRRPTA